MKNTLKLLALVLASVAGLVNAQPVAPGNVLPANGRLLPGASIYSPNGYYRLVMQTDGNLVLYNHAGAWLWKTDTHNRPGSFADFQLDGNLVVRDANGYPLFNIYDHSKYPHSVNIFGCCDARQFLAVEDSGVLNTYYSVVAWTSNTHTIGLGDGAALLYAGQWLMSNESLTSSSGRFRLHMQPDGNLVLTDLATGQVRWASNTHNHPGATAVMQTAGNFVVYSPAGPALWASTYTSSPDGKYSYLAVQDDGNLVVYSVARNFSTYMPASSGGPVQCTSGAWVPALVFCGAGGIPFKWGAQCTVYSDGTWNCGL